MMRPAVEITANGFEAPWYVEAAGFFGANFLEEYAGRMGEEQTRSEVRFVVDQMAATARAVLDVGCGRGRHAIALAEDGFRVTGIDLNAGMLPPSGSGRTRNGGRWNVVIADMRRIPFRESFDTAISLLSSFGYFPEAENLRTLAEIRRALRPGGRIIVDVLNADFVRWALVREEVTSMSDRKKIRHRRTFDPNTCRLLHERIHLDADTEMDRTYSDVRLYTPTELERLAARAGFQTVGVYGGYDQTTAHSRSPRLIYVGDAVA